MQIKTAIRYYLTHIRMAIVKKTRNNKCGWGSGEKETFVHSWWECKLVQTLWKIVWEILKKLQIELPHAPAIQFQGIYQKKMKTLTWKDICAPMFTAALFTMIKIWKQPKCPLMGEWMKKMYIYTQWNTIRLWKRMKACHLQHEQTLRALC